MRHGCIDQVEQFVLFLNLIVLNAVRDVDELYHVGLFVSFVKRSYLYLVKLVGVTLRIKHFLAGWV